jgi:hypothetical protein
VILFLQFEFVFQILQIGFDIVDTLISCGAIFAKEILLSSFPNGHWFLLSNHDTDNDSHGVLVDAILNDFGTGKDRLDTIGRGTIFLMPPISVAAL